MELPVWGWVVYALAIIGIGIGLGYLIIFLFWKIEERFRQPAPVQPEVLPAVLKPVEIAGGESPVNLEVRPAVEEETPEEMVEEIYEEEPVPAMLESSLTDEEKRFIKFTTVLHARFNHSFSGINTIACWDIGLEDGDEVRDPQGTKLIFRAIGSPAPSGAYRYWLVDESGNATISVVSAKQYIKNEANIDVDRINELTKPH